MKITDVQHGQVPGSVSEKNTAHRGEEGRFQKIMEQVAGKDRVQGVGVQSALGMPAPDGVQLIPGLEKPGAAHSGGAKDMLLGEIRETLDMIDRYAAGLGNTSMPASDMKPLVEHLEGRLESLRRMEAAPELPDKLRSVVSDLVITIGMETAKFGRGDYE
ncbi:MAG: hypothetical protein ACQET7_08645 [Thermodesulfobacteriota bacterium]